MYPALAVLQDLTHKPDIELLWVGGEGGMEASLVKRQGYPYRAIPAAGVHGVGLKTLPKNLLKIFQGVFASRKILRDFKPDVMFFTGGYVAFPMAVAGIGIPSILYVPDIEPGMALKALSWFANRILVTANTSKSYYANNRKVSEVGYPTRADLKSWTVEESLEEFNLSPERKTLMVFGGSQGARSINRAVIRNLSGLLEKYQIIHIAGKLDWDEVNRAKESLNKEHADHYRVYPYLHNEMGAAFTVADLVISRAGASTLGELPLFGLPAIVVPYPYAWRYQKVNADYLENHGAAIMIRDENLGEEILTTVRDLLDNPDRLDQMGSLMKELASPDAAERIGKHLINAAASTAERK